MVRQIECVRRVDGFFVRWVLRDNHPLTAQIKACPIVKVQGCNPHNGMYQSPRDGNPNRVFESYDISAIDIQAINKGM